MKFSQILNGEDIQLKRFTAKQSIDIGKKLKDFFKDFNKKQGEIDVSPTEAADFLIDISKYILIDVYKIENLTSDNFSDLVTMEEVCELVSQQVDANGKADFMSQPLKTLVEGIKRFSEELNSTVEKFTAENKSLN